STASATIFATRAATTRPGCSAANALTSVLTSAPSMGASTGSGPVCGRDASDEVTAMLVSFFFSGRGRHTRFDCDWSSDVCSSDLQRGRPSVAAAAGASRRRHGAGDPSRRRPAAVGGLPDTGFPQDYERQPCAVFGALLRPTRDRKSVV